MTRTTSGRRSGRTGRPRIAPGRIAPGPSDKKVIAQTQKDLPGAIDHELEVGEALVIEELGLRVGPDAQPLASGALSPRFATIAAGVIVAGSLPVALAVDRAVNAVLHTGITPRMLVERLRKWCETRDGAGRRRKIMLQLDELGQWIASGNANERIMQIQALVEEAAVSGKGRVVIMEPGKEEVYRDGEEIGSKK